jgi:hypothetical protein
MSVRCLYIVQCLIAIYLLALAPSVRAQVCLAPLPLPVNQTQLINTCEQGDANFQLACGAEVLSGPALEFQMNMPYPMGQILMQSMNTTYDPAAFLIRGQCKGDVPCAADAYVGMPGSTNTIDLYHMDSGTYYLVVAPLSGSPSTDSCGPVMVTWSATLGDETMMQDGVFRASFHEEVAH